MSRQSIRGMKHAVRAAGRDGATAESHVLAKEAALALLARSIKFGHPRLAVLRLAMAVQAGADVPASHWDYCRATVAQTKDLSLRALFDAACGNSPIRPTH
jgi:hypothetical protein